MATVTETPATAEKAEVARPTPPEPAARTGNPFEFMHRLSEEMDRAFDRIMEDFGPRMPRLLGRGRELLRREAGLIPAEWSPRVDVLRREGQLVVRADIPGLARDDLKVEVTDELLTIQGERTREKEEKEAGYAYRECDYGSFYRAIPLPEGVDASKATAEFRDGVLEVAMPASPRPGPQARRLEVREKK